LRQVPAKYLHLIVSCLLVPKRPFD